MFTRSACPLSTQTTLFGLSFKSSTSDDWGLRHGAGQPYHFTFVVDFLVHILPANGRPDIQKYNQEMSLPTLSNRHVLQYHLGQSLAYALLYRLYRRKDLHIVALLKLRHTRWQESCFPVRCAFSRGILIGSKLESQASPDRLMEIIWKYSDWWEEAILNSNKWTRKALQTIQYFMADMYDNFRH